MISVHLREQEIAYERTTKRPCGLHDHYRGSDPDPDRICPRREGAWGPPAGTKRPGHGRGYHSLRCPCRDSHSPVIRFRFRQSHEPLQNQYGQHNAVHTLPLYNRGYLRCHAMADAMAVSDDCYIPVIRSSCPASEPVRMSHLYGTTTILHPTPGGKVPARAFGIQVFFCSDVQLYITIKNISCAPIISTAHIFF
jgi:hypothetical protein